MMLFKKLKSKLSDAGKNWVDNTARLLHEAMTDLLKANPNIETNHEAFEIAAFETHSKAYIDGGILDLSIREKLSIFFTVSIDDLFKPHGLSQVWDVGRAQIQKWDSDPGALINEASDFITSYEIIREQIKVITSLPPHILSKSATVTYTDEEIDYMIYEVYKIQIAYFEENIHGFVSPIIL